MRLVLTAALLTLFGWHGSAQAQASFVLGLTTGLMMSGPNASGSAESGATNIMYLAPEETRRAIDPLDVRVVSVDTCVSGGLHSGISVREIINRAARNMPREHRENPTILRVMFLPATGNVCSAHVIHYTTPN